MRIKYLIEEVLLLVEAEVSSLVIDFVSTLSFEILISDIKVFLY